MKKQNEKKLLALDASSRIIGYSIFDIASKKLETVGYLDLSKETDLIKKVLKFEDLLETLQLEFNITEMVIEESLFGYGGGATSMNTIATLVSVNFGYRLICAKKNIVVNTISVNTARAYTFPKIPIRSMAKVRKVKEKEICFELAQEVLTNLLPKKELKSGKNKGKSVFESFSNDIADSWITGLGYLNKVQK